LHPGAIHGELQKMLEPAEDDLLEAFPVSRDLLRSKEPGPHCWKRSKHESRQRAPAALSRYRPAKVQRNAETAISRSVL